VVRLPAGAKGFSLLQIVKTGYYLRPGSSYSKGTGFLSRGLTGRDAKLTFALYLAPKLRMIAATRPTPIRLYGVHKDYFIQFI
jgi:hypothetical protein